MHFKSTFFLLLALVLAAGVVWMGRAPDEPAPVAPRKLLPIEPEEITYVSFYGGGEFIECVIEQGKWMLQKPVAARADSSRINRILGLLEMLPRGETITAAQLQARGLTLDEYGLVKPRARIVLGGANKRRLLSVGNEAPLKNAVYVQLDHDAEVVVTSTNLLAAIPGQAAELRDLRLLQGAADDVRRLEIRRLNEPLVELVKEGGEWVIHKPGLARADWGRVSRLLEGLFALAISRFVSDSMGDPAAYGLNEEDALLQIGVWPADDKTVDRLVFGNKADEQGRTVYAARRDSRALATVAREQVEGLLAASADLRDARLYFMAAEKIAWLRIEQGERALEFRKNADATWQIVEPQQGRADSRQVADLISRLNTFRFDQASEGTNAAALGLDHPAHIIRVADGFPSAGSATQGVAQAAAKTVEGQKRVLLVSAPQPGREYVFARFEDETPVYRISALSTATISMDPLSYRLATVLALDPAAILKITLRKNGREQAVERSGEVWQAAPPEAGEVDPVAVAELLNRAADLKVLRFEHSAVRDLAVYGLKDAAAALTFSLSGEGGIRKTLLFGDNSEDLGVYAMLQGQDMVFVLEKPLADALRRDLVR